MGLSVSDAIRLLMFRIADEHRMPFEIKVPNAMTRKAIKELESGKGERFTTVDSLMADMNADDCAYPHENCHSAAAKLPPLSSL